MLTLMIKSNLVINYICMHIVRIQLNVRSNENILFLIHDIKFLSTCRHYH